MSEKPKAEKSKGHIFILVGIIIGVLLGGLLGAFSPELGKEVYFLGELFLNALKMMVVPLVVASLIAGVAALGDVRNLGGVGGRTIVYYMVTTALSVTIGLILVNIIQPGVGLSPDEELPEAQWQISGDQLVLPEGTAFDKASLDDRFELEISLPDGKRLIGVLGSERQDSTHEIEVKQWLKVDDEGKRSQVAPQDLPETGTGVVLSPAVAEKVQGKEQSSILETLREVLIGLVPQNLFKAMVETDLLPLILFSLLFGAILTTLGPKGKLVLDVFDGVNDAVLKIVQLLMYFAPVGIFALIAGRIGEAGGWAGFWPELQQVFKYALTVMLALGFHALIVLPLILFIVGRRNPFRYLWQMLTPALTAFSTASSSGTLPVTLEAVEDADVDERTASFVIPLGATINMDGTALYEAVAAMFIAQMYGIDLGVADQIIIFLTATLAAIGAAGIPEAGLVTMVIVLNAVGLPIQGISLILIVDWFLDRCRTTVNVWGDTIGAAVVDRLEQGKLPPQSSLE